MKDSRGRNIEIGDTIVYPGRKSSSLWMTECEVLNITVGLHDEHRCRATPRLALPRDLVVNPNSVAINQQCTRIRVECESFNAARLAHSPIDPSHEVMVRIFYPLVKSCNIVVFRALPDGMFPAGVLKEITWAEAAGIPVLELPSAMMRRELSVAATKQYLKEIGQR